MFHTLWRKIISGWKFYKTIEKSKICKNISNNEKSYFASLDKLADVHNISYHSWKKPINPDYSAQLRIKTFLANITWKVDQKYDWW